MTTNAMTAPTREELLALGISADDVARFWQKVAIGGDDECWYWNGTRDHRGYGQIHLNGKRRRAHRVSWEIANGAVFPDGLHCCHSCDNPPCVNPKHLWPGSASENALDAVSKGRVLTPWQLWCTPHNTLKESCVNGHAFTPSNTIHTRRGKRECRVCKVAYQERYRERRRARAALSDGEVR